MTATHSNYGRELRRLFNRPNKPEKSSQYRSPGAEFSHLARKYSRQASRSHDTFTFASRLAENGNPFHAWEAVHYLAENQGSFATYNPRFGDALAAIARHRSYARKVNDLVDFTIRKFPANIAANQSMGEVFKVLMDSGFAANVGKKFERLTRTVPHLVATNPDTGWVIEELVKHNQVVAAFSAFMVSAKDSPGDLSRNPSLPKALKALRKSCTEKIFGKDKIETFNAICSKLEELSVQQHGIRPIHRRDRQD